MTLNRREMLRLGAYGAPAAVLSTAASSSVLAQLLPQSGVPAPDKLSYISHEQVMFFDTDCGGVVHNIAYLRMIETCRTRLAAQIEGIGAIAAAAGWRAGLHRTDHPPGAALLALYQALGPV